MDDSAGPVIGVLGGSGGTGSTTFAAVLAMLSAVWRGHGMLIDLDPAGGGIDIALGLETQPGARWSGLRLAGGYLDPGTLVDGLPQAGPCAVLAADTPSLDPEAVSQVLEAAVQLGPVVVDLPRAGCAERAVALDGCDLVVVLCRGDVAGLVATHTVVSALPERPIGLVVRRGSVSAHEAAELIGAPLLGTLPTLGAAPIALRLDRLPRRHVRVAAGVLSGFGTGVAPRAGVRRIGARV